jgi:formate dehydrogenase major subunit
VLWGSNARAAHPIWFHHALKGLRNGARMWCVDPRRTDSARFADVWLGLNVGSDVALANTVAGEIIAAGLHDHEFIDRATEGFEAFATHVEPYTLERGEELTGIPAAAIRELAHAYATAGTAQLCWTLGITEHHNAVDNVLSLINLALLTGHVGRWGSGLVPLRGQNNVQGGGDMGALPNKLPGFADVADPAARGRFEAVWGVAVPPEPGLHLSEMFDAMAAGDVRALYVIGENPATSEADVVHARELLAGLDTLVVQDIFLTQTAELADVVLPAAVAWAESEGTVTSSERRVQRVRATKAPTPGTIDDLAILHQLADRLGGGWGEPDAERTWDELRSLSPAHRGMRYDRLEAHGGLQWPCPAEDHPGTPFLHARLWAEPREGPPAPFSPVDASVPHDALSDEYPIRLTTGRVLDGYNSGVQSGTLASPIRSGDTLDLHADDLVALGLADGDRAKVSSRRGSIEMTVRAGSGLRPGLAFTTFHFSDRADVNVLVDDAWDPKSGTAAFKAVAVRVEPVGA